MAQVLMKKMPLSLDCIAIAATQINNSRKHHNRFDHLRPVWVSTAPGMSASLRGATILDQPHWGHS
jgi:hypothetical protein